MTALIVIVTFAVVIATTFIIGVTREQDVIAIIAVAAAFILAAVTVTYTHF